jgi:TPP-dependent pyruvate/acetoin dehydrogenase alpha subunit
MIAELYGKATGCSKGKGGSMHLVDVENGIMGASAVVGTTIPEAIGYAYGLKRQGSNAVVVIFFGDGATEEGVFYESLNFAALKELPIIFICENNLFAIYTHQKFRQKNTDITQRVKTFGVPAERIENDIFKVHKNVGDAIDSIRSGNPGPFFFECMTYRWKEHVGPNEDFDLGHRTIEEAQPWMDADQLEKVGTLLDPSLRTRIEDEIKTEVDAAFAFAEESPFPDDAELYTDIPLG